MGHPMLASRAEVERVRAIIAACSCGDIRFHLDAITADTVQHVMLVRAFALRKDNLNKHAAAYEQFGRQFAIQPKASRQQIERTLLLAATVFEEHETREKFISNDLHPFVPDHS
jgi:hypothetical protein